MNTMLSGMRRAAAVLQTTAQGSGELGMVIYHQKCVAESWSKLAQAKVEASKALYTWGKAVQNPATEEFFEYFSLLESHWIMLCEDMVLRCEYNGKVFKEILKGEKTLEELMEKQTHCDTKVTKMRKQKEAAKRGKPVNVQSKKGKQELNTEVELAKAMSLLQIADDELETHRRNHDKFKFMKMAIAFKDSTQMNITFHENATKIAEAQRQINIIYFKNINKTSVTASTEAQSVLSKLAEEINLSYENSLPGGSLGNDTGSQEEEESEYLSTPQKEIEDIPEAYPSLPLPPPETDTRHSRPLPPIPSQPDHSGAVYDNRSMMPSEDTSMDIYEDTEYESYDTYQNQGQRSAPPPAGPAPYQGQQGSVYEPLQRDAQVRVNSGWSKTRSTEAEWPGLKAAQTVYTPLPYNTSDYSDTVVGNAQQRELYANTPRKPPGLDPENIYNTADGQPYP